MVGINQTEGGGNGDRVEISSTLAISGQDAAELKGFAELKEGLYYCRVQMSNMNSMSNSSRQFYVNIDQYLQYAARCDGRNFIYGVEECAVYPTVEDIPTTTPDTTTSQTQKGDTTTTQHDEKQPTQTPPSSSNPRGGGTLEVWIYVLVAVAAVFAMIIIILAIMCVGLCLRRSQTMDANSLKRKLPRPLPSDGDCENTNVCWKMDMYMHL